jgi:hypothetical protein
LNSLWRKKTQADVGTIIKRREFKNMKFREKLEFEREMRMKTEYGFGVIKLVKGLFIV